MADIDDENGYSDDDLDALESEDFLRLQEQALSASHHHPQAAPRRGQPITAEELGLDSLDAGKAGFQARTGPSQSISIDVNDAVDNGEPNDSAQRLDESDIAKDATLQRTYAREYGQDLFHSDLPHRAGASQGNENQTDATDLAGNARENDDRSLRQRMELLLREKDNWSREKASLRQVLEQTRKDVLGKSGEIAVLRSKHTKQLQDQDKFYQVLQQQHKEQEASHRRNFDEARKEKERLVTHNRFLDHENNDQAWQARRNRPTDKSKDQAGLLATPRRQRHQIFADGFEDEELESRSPSKPQRTKPVTPTAGAKRKRDSLNLSPALSLGKPIPSLALVPSGESPALSAPQKATPSFPEKTGDRLSHFVHEILNHRLRPDEPRLLEQLASICLPSSPEISLYEMFLDKVPPKTTISGTEDIPASIGLIVVELWSACLHERFYKPLKVFVELTNYVLFNGSMTTAVRLMDEVINLAQGTADINVIPRFKKLNKNAKVISVHLHDQAIESSEHVDVHQCLDLLYLTATLCARDQDAMARFWHCMRFDFISMLLRVVQPIPDVISTVRLLSTCVRHDLLSAIKSQNTDGTFAEQHVMDRVTSMLIETPRPMDGEAVYEVEDVLKLRLEILHLLEKICEQKAACHALAVHPQGIGRLVRLMSDELNEIYANPFYMAQRSDIINRTTRLLFHVTGTYSQEIDLREKLQQQPGGVNKFLISLARLAFSDAMFYERDIKEDTFDCAHQLLENFVTPEEAESLKAAFVKDEE